jgi:hypothetical protein
MEEVGWYCNWLNLLMIKTMLTINSNTEVRGPQYKSYMLADLFPDRHLSAVWGELGRGREGTALTLWLLHSSSFHRMLAFKFQVVCFSINC